MLSQMKLEMIGITICVSPQRRGKESRGTAAGRGWGHAAEGEAGGPVDGKEICRGTTQECRTWVRRNCVIDSSFMLSILNSS